MKLIKCFINVTKDAKWGENPSLEQRRVSHHDYASEALYANSTCTDENCHIVKNKIRSFEIAKLQAPLNSVRSNSLQG